MEYKEVFKIFYRDKTEGELTFADAKYYVDLFITRYLPRIQKLENYYENKNEKITNRTFKDLSKPNNKIHHSFSNYITTINTALFLGKPITYSSNDDLTDFTEVLKTASEEDTNLSLAVKCSEYGYAIQLVWLNEDAELKFHVFDNKEIVLIYSNDIQNELLYAVRFWKTENIHQSTTEWLEIYSPESVRRYKDGILNEEQINFFSKIPIIVYLNNDDKKGDAENVLDIIDAYDFAESDTVNEKEYFNDAYLYLNSDDVEEKDVENIKEKRVLFGENLNPQFVLKQHVDNEPEKTRFVTDIHKLSFTPDLSDNNFANNVSGVAMKYKLLGTLSKIQAKQRKFTVGIKERNKLIFDYMYVSFMSIPETVEPIFSDTLPTNTLELAQTINQLRGLVSNETLLEQIPFVNDIDNELIKLKEENRSLDMYEDFN